MLRVEKTGKFKQLLDELHLTNPELKTEIDQRIRWFQKNPQDTRLRNHYLTGRMAEMHAFSITGDIRIVYEWIGKTTVRFLAIGGHKRVYGKRQKG